MIATGQVMGLAPIQVLNGILTITTSLTTSIVYRDSDDNNKSTNTINELDALMEI